jgi:hypothetical protein
MREGTSQGQRKISPVVAGLGAAFVGVGVTLAVIMSSPSPVAVSDQAASSSKECQMIQRKLLVSSTTGGTVRLREGSYLSPPIVLTDKAQGVVFPLPRPETTPLQEVIAIEGNANGVVITSEVSEYRQVFPTVTGVLAFSVIWKPMKGC